MNIIFIILGLLTGIITGLIPGLHVNNVALICLGLSAFFLQYFSGFDIAIFLISMSIMHSFVDFIPAIFLGAPEDSTALGVLPGHKLLLKGLGFSALQLTVFGGLFSVIFGAYLCILFVAYIESIYLFVYGFAFYILITVSFLSIVLEKKLKKIFWGLFTFVISGVVGILTLEFINISNPLFPMLSGFFGISFLFMSILTNPKIMPQKIVFEDISFVKNIPNFLKTIFSSILTSILPGIGAAQAAFISRIFSRKDNRGFLVILGGINSISIVFMFSVLFFIGKARNGIYSAINSIFTFSYYQYYYVILIMVIGAIIASVITILIGMFFSKNISKMNYRKINLIIILFIGILCLLLSGIIGIYILILSSIIGLIPQLTGIKKTHLMGCLIIPVIFWIL